MLLSLLSLITIHNCMLLSLPYLHDTIKLASPKFPKPVITFLIANMFTSAITKRHDGFKGDSGATVGLSAILRKMQFLSVIVHRQNCPATYTYKNIIFKTSINNIVCESITILIPRLNPLV